MFSLILNIRIFFTNFFFTNFFLFSLFEIHKCIYYYLFSQRKQFAATLEENKKTFAKKIRRFGIRENMSRTGYISTSQRITYKWSRSTLTNLYHRTSLIWRPSGLGPFGSTVPKPEKYNKSFDLVPFQREGGPGILKLLQKFFLNVWLKGVGVH